SVRRQRCIAGSIALSTGDVGSQCYVMLGRYGVYGCFCITQHGLGACLVRRRHRIGVNGASAVTRSILGTCGLDFAGSDALVGGPTWGVVRQRTGHRAEERRGGKGG